MTIQRSKIDSINYPGKLPTCKNSFSGKCFLILLSAILMVSCFLSACKSKASMQHISTHAFRLKPGQDLKEEIQKLVTDKQIKAGWISTCVGSLTNYNIRFANQPNGFSDSGHFEIVSLTGTVSTNGSHIHISISDSTGKTIGGHLLDGCKVYTTAEIVIQSSSQFEFKREKDGTTPWEELQVKE
jgi:predicted DNA-binding protein with PD1-like motif